MLKFTFTTITAELEIELKKDSGEFRLLVMLSKSAYFRESGRAWHGITRDEKRVIQLVALVKQASLHPSNAKKITINDGMFTIVHLKDYSQEIKLLLKEYEQDSIELQLVKSVFAFVIDLLEDAELITCLREFGAET